MVYWCGYFHLPDDTLDAAQLQKIDHILTKLRVQPGNRLLDIGCGWGALVMRAAENSVPRRRASRCHATNANSVKSGLRAPACRTAAKYASKTIAT